jgi:hypothetical protein
LYAGTFHIIDWDVSYLFLSFSFPSTRYILFFILGASGWPNAAGWRGRREKEGKDGRGEEKDVLGVLGFVIR